MRNLVAEIGTLVTDADGIAEAQTAAGAEDLVLDGALVEGGIASLTYAQAGTVTSSGDDTGITFTFTGLDSDGTEISQTITGANAGAASTTAFFKEFWSVSTSGATDGDVEVGVLAANGAVSRSLRVNGQQMNFKNGVFLLIDGTLTASAEYTYMQPEDEYAISYSASADWREVTNVDDETASAEGEMLVKVNAMRLKLSAYTSGTVTLTITQSY